MLNYDLVHVSLDSKPRYSALSYTWGKPGDEEEICIDGKPFDVRQNLHDALWHIRVYKKAKKVAVPQDKYLWVDAICINQSTDEAALDERSSQVRLMTRIYEQANHVMVWLGKAKDELNNQLAFEKMKELSEKFDRIGKWNRPYRPWLWPQGRDGRGVSSEYDVSQFSAKVTASERAALLKGPESRRPWLGMVELWNSPWWTRTWVYQEGTVPERRPPLYWGGLKISSGSSKCKFLCSDKLASWFDISNGIIISARLAAQEDFLQGLTQTMISLKAVISLGQFRERRVNIETSSLLDVLHYFRHTQCQDPIDKVYAPLCLAQKDAFEAISPWCRRGSTFEVYMSVVKYCLTKRGHELDFLGYTMWASGMAVPDLDGDCTWPSWLPNWLEHAIPKVIPKTLYVTVEAGAVRPSLYVSENKWMHRDLTLTRSFDASAGTQCSAQIVGRELRVWGIFCDSIQDILPDGSGPDVLSVCREKLRKWRLDAVGRYPTREKFLDAYWSTNVMDLEFDGVGRPRRRGGSLDPFLWKKNPNMLTQAEVETKNRMRIACTSAKAHRRLCLSKNGYLVLAPASAMAGDLIFAIFGGQVLYILRGTTEEHPRRLTFIGEAYVHGLMDGEVIKWLGSDGGAWMEELILI
jgi:hypothetical protein